MHGHHAPGVLVDLCSQQAPCKLNIHCTHGRKKSEYSGEIGSAWVPYKESSKTKAKKSKLRVDTAVQKAHEILRMERGSTLLHHADLAKSCTRLEQSDFPFVNIVFSLLAFGCF